MNLRILKALLHKELLLLRRDPFISRMIIAMPIMVMLILPLIADNDVRNVGVVVVDHDRSELSRRIAADMDASEYLTVKGTTFRYADAMGLIESGEADAIVVVPSDFSQTFSALEIDANGVNATKGMLGARYAAMSIGQTLAEWQAEAGRELPAATTSILNVYNPTLNYRNYMIPALMVVLLIMICGFLPTLNLVSEKETGTIEAMNVTPVGRFTFVLSKLIPYWVIGLLVVTIGMVVGRLVYGLAPAGNIGLIYLATVLFSLVMSGLGVMIANGSSTILQSMFVSFAFVMVFQLMSGLFTPIASMPAWAQAFTWVVPPRYFIEIMRAVYLKGAGWTDLWQQFALLASFAVGLCLLAALTYRKQA